MQKNGSFYIGHLYSKNQIAIKAHYLIVQIAHAIRQLLEKGSLIVRKEGLIIDEISRIIRTEFTDKILRANISKKIQLRFYDWIILNWTEVMW